MAKGGGKTSSIAPIRVAWVVTPLPAQGGTLTHISAWAKGTDLLEIAPILLYHSRDEDSGYHLELPDSLTRVRLPSLDYTAATFPRAVADLEAAVTEREVDLIHTIFIKSDLVGGIAGAHLDIPVVSTVEGDLLVTQMGSGRRFLAARAYRRVSRHFARILAVSRATARHVEGVLGGRERRIDVVYPGVSVPGKAPMRSRWDAMRVVATGRLVPVKRFDRLIAAVGIARAFLPELQLIIVGDGPEREALARQIDASGLNGVIRITGWLPPGEVASWYDQAHLVAISSRSEGLPWSALEAMARGVPVLAPRVGGLPELIEDDQPKRQSGFLVDSGRVPDLVSGLLRAFRGPGAQKRLETVGIQARRRVAERFSSHREMAELRDIYHQVVSKRMG